MKEAEEKTESSGDAWVRWAVLSCLPKEWDDATMKMFLCLSSTPEDSLSPVRQVTEDQLTYCSSSLHWYAKHTNWYSIIFEIIIRTVNNYTWVFKKNQNKRELNGITSNQGYVTSQIHIWTPANGPQLVTDQTSKPPSRTFLSLSHLYQGITERRRTICEFTSFKINQNETNNTKNTPHPPEKKKERRKHTLSLGNLNQYTQRVLHLDIIIIILS